MTQQQIIADLRSDTVTRPSQAMRQAMVNAEVGDDMFGDDPTVNRLEKKFAALSGKEAALFVTSGVQGNQICLRCHAVPGNEVICDANSHIVHYEGGAPAAINGLSLYPLPGRNGIFTGEMVRGAIRPDNIHNPITALVVVENTHNRGGGAVWPIEQVEEVVAVAREYGLKTHLDGARIFNAVVVTGLPLERWARYFDSISVCFSKGLGAPVGSIIAGTAEFIRKARRARKIMGGAMRQAGIIAAAAEYALDNNVSRLAQDHTNAALFAQLLGESPAFDVEPDLPTNMIFWNLRGTSEQATALVERCKKRGVLFFCVGGTRFRAVTHLDVNEAAVRNAADIIKQEAGQTSRAVK